jgi:hypothetical protein
MEEEIRTYARRGSEEKGRKILRPLKEQQHEVLALAEDDDFRPESQRCYQGDTFRDDI